MRRHKSRRRSKQGKIIIITSICLLFIMTAGYAAFSTNLSITAKGTIKSQQNIYVSSTGNDETGEGTKESPYLTISKAYTVAALEATIYVMDNLTINESVTFDKDKKITLTSEDTEVNSLLRGEEDEYLILQTAGELTLTNITLDGQNKQSNWSLLASGYGSTLNLNEGTTIQNNIDTQDYGGGMLTYYATVKIDGAKIINNVARSGGGGGILSNYSNITIESGEISGNSAIYSGGSGIYFVFKNDEYGLLTMNGGTIKNNSGGGYGGGIYVGSADMIMNGGEISGNSAPYIGGVAVVSHGGLPDVHGTFTMRDGQIINNTATDQWFAIGGVAVKTSDGSTYTYEGGTVANNVPNDADTF